MIEKIKSIRVRHLFWAIYISLLAVLLPHTAWMFIQFEPPGERGEIVAWLAAFTFEASVAILTHKLSERIGSTPRYTAGTVWIRRLWFQYGNVYAAALLVVVSISALANLAHAVAFGQPLELATAWGVSPKLFSLAFGALLPFTSLVFACVLSDVAETEVEHDDALTQANIDNANLRLLVKNADKRAGDAEQRFAAAGDLFARLFANEKKERIRAIADTWPQLSGTAIAAMAESSPSYVSEVLSGTNGAG